MGTVLLLTKSSCKEPDSFESERTAISKKARGKKLTFKLNREFLVSHAGLTLYQDLTKRIVVSVEICIAGRKRCVGSGVCVSLESGVLNITFNDHPSCGLDPVDLGEINCLAHFNGTSVWLGSCNGHISVYFKPKPSINI
ncbi:MAG: hypothetical protein H6779_01715 [Candidatus Nomurabacteria bacterium]|nr:hypothetical protein [Candidatus Nomurabacteria bacterium]USN88145.1 MAG: hypothetical protein H6779_01715 [Candidatus Nomurabacteria bacterium]